MSNDVPKVLPLVNITGYTVERVEVYKEDNSAMILLRAVSGKIAPRAIRLYVDYPTAYDADVQ